MAGRNFEPLIKTTTLRDKEVEIKDTMNFERRIGTIEEPEASSFNQEREEKRRKTENRRKATMKTQKMSLDVILKLDIIDPFLRSAEHIDHDGKLSINEKIDLLIESYVQNKLTTRQREGFQAVYDTYTEQ